MTKLPPSFNNILTILFKTLLSGHFQGFNLFIVNDKQIIATVCNEMFMVADHYTRSHELSKRSYKSVA